MNTSYLADVAEFQINKWWNIIRRIYADHNLEKPAFNINKRLKVRLGYACLNNNTISLSAQNFWEYTELFCTDIIAHELAHIVAYQIHGDTGHGIGWQMVMQNLGLTPILEYTLE